MKHALNKTNKLTRNRKLILLNFSLIFLTTIVSGWAFDSTFAALMGCLVSSLAFRILFGWTTQREFGDNKTIIAANGKTFKIFHKRIVQTVMISSLIGGWILGVNLKSSTFSPLDAGLLNLFIFQFATKLTLFIIDLPIATFNVDQRNVDHSQMPQPYQSSIIGNSNDMYFSPSYSSLSCNSYNRGN